MARGLRVRVRVRVLARSAGVCAATCTMALAIAATPALAHGHGPARFYVGAARIDVTPTPAQLAEGFYNGGYGIGPVHAATSVVRDIYFRVIAIRDRNGHQAGIGAL